MYYTYDLFISIILIYMMILVGHCCTFFVLLCRVRGSLLFCESSCMCYVFLRLSMLGEKYWGKSYLLTSLLLEVTWFLTESSTKRIMSRDCSSRHLDIRPIILKALFLSVLNRTNYCISAKLPDFSNLWNFAVCLCI